MINSYFKRIIVVSVSSLICVRERGGIWEGEGRGRVGERERERVGDEERGEVSGGGGR